MMRIQVNRIKVAVQITFLLILVAAAQGILSLRFGTFRFLDLPLIFSVFYGFTLSNPVASVAIGSWVGLMQDSLSGGAFGANGFSKTLFGFIAASAGGKFNVEQPLTRCFALFLFSLGDGLLTTMLGLVAESPLRLSSDMAMTWVVSGMF
ncbi:MAG TPA: rod shape-determining protein MreD, partial [Terriglobia bacterium]|nr:rod shape-determining protein MreD [Terriglobia bacterium]